MREETTITMPGCKSNLILDVYIYYLLGVQFSNPPRLEVTFETAECPVLLREKWRAKEEEFRCV